MASTSLPAVATATATAAVPPVAAVATTATAGSSSSVSVGTKRLLPVSGDMSSNFLCVPIGQRVPSLIVRSTSKPSSLSPATSPPPTSAAGVVASEDEKEPSFQKLVEQARKASSSLTDAAALAMLPIPDVKEDLVPFEEDSSGVGVIKERVAYVTKYKPNGHLEWKTVLPRPCFTWEMLHNNFHSLIELNKWCIEDEPWAPMRRTITNRNSAIMRSWKPAIDDDDEDNPRPAARVELVRRVLLVDGEKTSLATGFALSDSHMLTNPHYWYPLTSVVCAWKHDPDHYLADTKSLYDADLAQDFFNGLPQYQVLSGIPSALPTQMKTLNAMDEMLFVQAPAAGHFKRPWIPVAPTINTKVPSSVLVLGYPVATDTYKQKIEFYRDYHGLRPSKMGWNELQQVQDLETQWNNMAAHKQAPSYLDFLALFDSTALHFAPGAALAINEEEVKYEATTTSGMSGGPVMPLDLNGNVFEFVGTHHGTWSDIENKLPFNNRVTTVLTPHFVTNWLHYVLPRLVQAHATQILVLNTEEQRKILEYLSHVMVTRVWKNNETYHSCVKEAQQVFTIT